MKKPQITIATDNPVSEKFLEEKLKAYATKVDLRTEIALVKLEINESEARLDEKNRGYRDQILTGIDKVVKELLDMREENAASTLHFERTDEKLKEHDIRIKTLEHAKN